MSLLSTSAYLLATVVCICITNEVFGKKFGSDPIGNEPIWTLPSPPAAKSKVPNQPVPNSPPAAKSKVPNQPVPNSLPVDKSNVPSRTEMSSWPASSNTSVLGLVHSFVWYFNQSVQADPKLKNAFAVQRLGGAREAEKFYSDVVYQVHVDIGDLKPDFAAQTVADAVGRKFAKVTTDYQIGIFAFSAGYLAYVQEAITPENVKDLAQRFFEKVKSAVYAVADPSQEAQLKGVISGFIDFLTFNRFFRQDNAPLLATIFANEWYKL